MGIEAIVLGSGQDGGAPQFGSSTRRGSARTASSIAVRSSTGALVLLDVTPDLRMQWQRLDGLGWVSNGTDDLAAIAITHGHMGHYAGLVHLGKEAANVSGLPTVALPSVHAFLHGNEPWGTLYSAGHLTPHDATAPFRVDDEVTIAAIRVPHRAEFTATAAFSVRVEGVPWLLYLPDIDAWDEWDEAQDVIGEHQISLVDATFSSPDELPGRDIGSIRHPLVADTVDRFATLTGDRRIVLTHLNHSNPVTESDSDIARTAAWAGFEVAFDGMRFEGGT